MSTKLGTLTLDLVARISSFTQGMRDASASAEREMGRAGNSVNTMDGLLKKLAVTAGAVFSISQVANYADSYTGMINKLKLVTKTQGELTQAMNNTYQIAQATASDWESVITVYTKFQKISEKLGLSQEDVSRITETVTKAVAMSGATADEAQRALMQFGQALNTGSLKGQDLNSILSQTPGLTDAIAEGMGVASGSLKELGAAGKLTNEMVITSLQKVATSIDDKYAETATLISSSFDLVKNSAKKMIGEFDAANGISAKFVVGMKGIAENLGTITEFMVVGAAFMAGTYIPMIVKGTYVTIADTVAKVTNVLAARSKAIADYDVAKSNLAATASMVRAMGVTNAQTAAMMANARAAYQQAAAAKTVALSGASLSSVLLGPVGVGVALASVAAGYLLMKGSADKATASIEYQGQKVDDLVVKYRELNTLQRDNETKALADQVEELGLKYRVASSDLSVFMEGLPIADDKIATFTKLNSQLSLGKITSVEYYEAVKKVNILTDTQLNKVRGLIVGYEDSKKAFGEAEKAQKALSAATGSATGEIKKQAGEVAGLNEELKKLIDLSSTKTRENELMSSMVGSGVEKGLADLILEYRKAEGLLGKSGRLSDASIKSIGERWKSEKGLNQTLEERTKAEEKSKKLIEAQGAAMKVNALVASNAAKANYAALESAKKLPKGLLSAVNMTESPNSNYAKSGAGAQGAFQFMPKTAAEYKVDVSSVESSSRGASEYLSKLLKMFEGNIENALRAYNWGEGNMQNYLKYGSGKKNGDKGYFADKPMPKETRDYSGKVLGYMGGASGTSFSDGYTFNDYVKEQEKFAIEREKQAKEQAEKQKEIQLGISTETVRIRSELADKLKDIDGAGFDAVETARLKTEYTTRADNEIKIADSAHADKLAEYSDYVKTEEQLINQSYERRQRDLKLDLALTADEYKKLSVLLEGERDKELQKAAWRALEVRQAMQDQIDSLSAGSDDVRAQSAMSPQAYAKWALENNRGKAQLGLKNDRANVEQEILYSDAYSTDDDRYAALLEAHQEYRDGLAAIDTDYDKQVKDLSQSQYEGQLSLWGGLLGQAQNTWSQMTQAVKDSEGEQSGTFKAMFLMQQTFAMGSALVSAHLAATQVAADATIPFFGAKILASKAMLAMGYANVGMIAGQTIAGMAHDGIDNIPKEGTWLLDKGERVVDSRTNADLKDYLAKGGGGGNVIIKQSISIASDGTATTQNDSKQLGALINNAVLAVIRKEQRQGGLLSK